MSVLRFSIEHLQQTIANLRQTYKSCLPQKLLLTSDADTDLAEIMEQYQEWKVKAQSLLYWTFTSGHVFLFRL